ncbi:MAG: site-specific integrase [Clostridiaceae bacterium]|nr:site-specific integrase [Clostridiaceae bacterium]
MSKIAKPKKTGKAGKPATPEWTPRISQRTLANGTAWRADWWERGASGGDYVHRSKQCGTRAELDEWIEAERKERAKDDKVTRRADKRRDSIVALANLSPKEKAAIAAAVASLRAAGGGAEVLADAVKVYAKTHLTGARKKVWRIVGEHLRIVRQRRRPATYADRRRNLAPLVADHGRKLAATFSPATAEDWIFAANTDSMRAARRRAAHAVFEFAMRRGYIDRNPVATVERVEPAPRDEVCILTAADAAELMSRAEKHAPALVPYLAIGLFGGLRPMNELRGVVWERDIDLAGGNITVRRASSKTNRARLVPISPNLRAWLETVPPSRRKGGIYYSRRLLDWIAGKEPRQDRRIAEPGKIKRKAKADGKKTRPEFEPIPWGQDILRHTRTSYRLAQTQNAPMVAEEGGHTLAIMRQHYVNRTIRAAEVKAFWNILPTKAARKSKGK